MSEQPKSRYLVQVNYKSGKTMEIWCEQFDIKHNSGVLTSLSYVVDGGELIKPLYFGALESVESVYQLKHEVFVDSNTSGQ